MNELRLHFIGAIIGGVGMIILLVWNKYHQIKKEEKDDFKP